MSAKVLKFEDAAKAMKVELISNGRGTQAVQETVVAMRANRRAGTHCVKTKATVQKSGSKPWNQKGTGRARAGYAASPVWRGGGVVFGPHPRDYSKKVSKSTKKLALKKALSARIQAGDVLIVPELKMKSHKTGEFAKWLTAQGATGSTLIVDVTLDKNVVIASKNIPKTEAVAAELLNTEQLLRYGKIVMTSESLDCLGKRLNAVREKETAA